MKCPKCGTENDEKVCKNCGNNLDDIIVSDGQLNSIINETKKIIEENKKIVDEVEKDESDINNAESILLEEPTPTSGQELFESTDISNSKIQNLPQDEQIIANPIINESNSHSDWQPFEEEISVKEEVKDKLEEESQLNSEVQNISENNDIQLSSPNDIKSEMVSIPTVEQPQSLVELQSTNEEINSGLSEPIKPTVGIEQETPIDNNIVIEPLVPIELVDVEKPVVKDNYMSNNSVENGNQVGDNISNNELIAEDLSSTLPDSKVDEKDNIQLFIGKNAEKIQKSKVGVIPGFLGNIWFLYRKCYFMGLLFGLIDIALLLYVILLSGTPIYFYLIFRFFVYFAISKKLYIIHVNRKIKKLTKKTNDVDISELKKNGGVSLVAPIVYSIVALTVVVGGFIYIYNTGAYQFYNLKVLASGWELDEETGGLIYQDAEKTCTANIYYGTFIDELITSKLYQRQIITEEQYTEKLEFNFDGLEKENIHGVEWSKVTTLNENGITEDIYLTIKDGAVYYISLSGNSEDEYGLCQDNFNKLKNNLRF